MKCDRLKNLSQKNGGVAQLGERTVRIRKVESSILFVSTTFLYFGALAQLGERYTGSVEVTGSIPVCSTIGV